MKKLDESLAIVLIILTGLLITVILNNAMLTSVLLGIATYNITVSLVFMITVFLLQEK